MTAGSSTEELAAFLDENELQVTFRPADIPTSIIHDLSYRIAILGLAFEIVGSAQKDFGLKLNSTVLSLAQFVVIRPKMFADFKSWVESREGRERLLEEWPLLPRGHFSDSVHINLISALIAVGALKWVGNDYLLWPSHSTGNAISKSLEITKANMVFEQERKLLLEFKRLCPSLKDLGVR